MQRLRNLFRGPPYACICWQVRDVELHTPAQGSSGDAVVGMPLGRRSDRPSIFAVGVVADTAAAAPSDSDSHQDADDGGTPESLERPMLSDAS